MKAVGAVLSFNISARGTGPGLLPKMKSKKVWLRESNVKSLFKPFVIP